MALGSHQMLIHQAQTQMLHWGIQMLLWKNSHEMTHPTYMDCFPLLKWFED